MSTLAAPVSTSSFRRIVAVTGGATLAALVAFTWGRMAAAPGTFMMIPEQRFTTVEIEFIAVTFALAGMALALLFPSRLRALGAGLMAGVAGAYLVNIVAYLVFVAVVAD